MGLEFVTAHKMVWMVLVMILSAGLSWIYYRYKLSSEFTKAQGYLLLMLRFVVLVFIGFLLLKPVMKLTVVNKKEPLIIVAVDHSQSIVNNSDSLEIKTKIRNSLDKLVAEFKKDVHVELISFGTEISDSLSYDFSETGTNFEQIFSFIEQKHYKQNMGALVIASDGLVNAGVNPQYLSKWVDYPIYCIPLGDTNIVKDALIQEVEHNDRAYLGNQFPVIVKLKANQLSKQNIKVIIEKNNHRIGEKTITPESDDYFTKIPFTIEAKDTGLHLYTVKLETTVQENVKNNVRQFVIDVHNQKEKILLLHNGYHPDIAVFNKALKNSSVYELAIQNVNTFSGKISDFELVILYQLPNNTYDSQKLFSELTQSEIPLWFVFGETSSILNYNKLYPHFKLNIEKNIFYDAQGFFSRSFSLFTNEYMASNISNYPPLKVPYGDFSPQPKNKILLNQQIANAETDKPLWFFVTHNNQRVAYLLGEGIWKWRIKEYTINRSFDLIDNLIVKSVQYLTVSERKDALQIEMPQNFNKGNDIVLYAKTYNQTNEPINNNSVLFTLMDGQANTYKFIFDRFENYHRLNLGKLASGRYSYKATTHIDAMEYEKNGKFIVTDSNLENVLTQANNTLLNKIATNSGAQMFALDQLDALVAAINSDETLTSQKFKSRKYADLLNEKLLFLALLLVLAIEWFLRKFWGTV